MRVDLSPMKGVPPTSGRKYLSNMLKEAKIQKLAFYGMSTISKVIAGFIASAAGINAKFFTTEKEALDYLNK